MDTPTKWLVYWLFASFHLPFRNVNSFNDAYLRDISIKVRSGLEVKRKKGDFVGSFPVYGYKRNPENRYKLIVDEYAGEIVKNIFKWKIEGLSQQRIAEKLNEQGILSPVQYKKFCNLGYQSSFQVNSSSKWCSSSIGRILKNEIYTGTLIQGRTTTPNHKVKTLIVKPREEWNIVENSHEALVSFEDFEIVNQVFATDTRVSPNKKSVYPFSGMLVCSDCGAGLIRSSTVSKGKSRYFYICGTNRRTKKCSSHRITDNALNEAVLLSIKHHIATIIDIEKILKNIDIEPLKSKDVGKLNVGIKAKEDEIQRYIDLKSALFESLSEGILDKPEYLRLKNLYDEKQILCVKAISNLKEELSKLLSTKDETTWIKKFKTYQNIENIDRKIVVNLIDKITVYEDKRIDIAFKYQYSYDLALSLAREFDGGLNNG